MQFKKSRAILSAVLATAMASSALLSVAASAERTAEEHFGDETYAQRFASLYYDVVTKGTDNGYLSKDGVPYHSVEELICEAPDYGHETTSEAMSYIVTVGAMYDNIANKGIVDGMSKGELAKAWKILEALIPSADQQGGFWAKDSLSAQVAAEYPYDVTKYPSEGNSSNTGANPLHSKLVSAYKSEGREYLLHWLADVDDWYGFGGSARGEKGSLTFINTFQRGDQESCFETVPHPSIETLEYGNKQQGMKFAFQQSTAESWSYTNAPDAEDRAIQGVYAANRWGVGDSSVSTKAAMMGDMCRNDMYDKYYKEIGCQSMQSPSAGDNGKHYLMAWYTAWGGDGSSQHSWAWQIGCSHAHQFYQNPLAAFGLLYDKSATGLAGKMQANGAEQDYEMSLTRQLELYLWLSSAEGPFAGGVTNCWMGDYETYPSGVPTFHKMAYIEQPVYADPGSNNWTGNQFWATQRLAELYYIVCTDADAEKASANIKPGGMSIKEALKTVLDKWVKWFTDNTELTDDGLFAAPSSIKWEGAPESWNEKYVENTNLHAKVNGMNTSDLGCLSSYANTLMYYAAANGVKASGTVEDDPSNLAQHGLYIAQQLLDREWKVGRDNIGLSLTEHNGSLARFWEQEVYIPAGNSGTYPYGYEVKNGAKFIDLRPMYKDEGQSYSKLYAELEAAYKKDKEGGATIKEFDSKTQDYNYGMDCATDSSAFTNVADVDLHYHRFWHAGDIMWALGTMTELYPDLVPDGKVDPDPGDDKTDWGNVDESEGASPKERVDVSDVVLLARYLNEDETAVVSKQGKLNADVNASGKPDTDDMAKILKFVAKLIPYESLGTTKDN